MTEDNKTLFIVLTPFIPDPDQFAKVLPIRVAEALCEAWPGRDGLRVYPHMAAELRNYSLVGCGVNYLTAFGIAVRRELMI